MDLQSQRYLGNNWAHKRLNHETLQQLRMRYWAYFAPTRQPSNRSDSLLSTQIEVKRNFVNEHYIVGKINATNKTRASGRLSAADIIRANEKKRG